MWHRFPFACGTRFQPVGHISRLTPPFPAITLARMFQTFVTAYPWDLIDDDLSGILDRLKGEIGIDGVSVWMATPPLVRLRVRDVDPRVFRTRGGLFFHQNEERYENTRCKPILSTWAKPKDPLARIAHACDERGLKLRIVLSASRTGRIAQRQPEMACKNLFGAPSEEGLCLSNPDVQTFLGSLVEDLSSRYPLDGVTLADFQTCWAETLSPCLETHRSFGEVERCLLGLCFCESCQQGAEADSVAFAAARDTARDVIEMSIKGERPSEGSYTEMLDQHKSLAVYQSWRGRELSTLLQSLQGRCERPLRVDCRISGVERYMQGGMKCGEVGVGVQISLDDPYSTLELCAKRETAIRLPSDWAIGSRAQCFVASFSKAVEVGVESIEFDDLGLLPDAALEIVRQAIRCARRNAGA